MDTITGWAAIKALRVAAGEAGDLLMVALCDRAEEGDAAARAACERAIAAAEAMDDD